MQTFSRTFRAFQRNNSSKILSAPRTCTRKFLSSTRRERNFYIQVHKYIYTNVSGKNTRNKNSSHPIRRVDRYVQFLRFVTLVSQSPWRKIVASSVKLHESHWLLRVHTPHVLINVRGLLAAEIAVRALIPGRFAALVPVMTEHGVPSAVTVVAVGTVELAGVRIVLYVPFPTCVLLPAHGMKLHGPATYKRSCTVNIVTRTGRISGTSLFVRG